MHGAHILEEMLRSKMDAMITSFVREVRAHKLGTRRTDEEIVFELRRFIDAIISSLRRKSKPDVAEIAARHGEQRCKIGYDLRGVLVEFGILSTTMIAIAKRADPTVEEIDRLMAVIDASRTDAAVAFHAHAAKAQITEAGRASRRSRGRGGRSA
jgi:hypothetical protein